MDNSKNLFLLLFLISLSGLLKAQDMILNSKFNKFLINQKSDKPRLDVIVESFTNYEKNVISKRAVMDITTKPTFERVSDTEYNVTASRMGEKLTFVIRNFEKLQIPYGTSSDIVITSSQNSRKEAGHYILGKEKCARTQYVPFGVNKFVMKITDSKNREVYRLNVKFTYLKPQLYYVDMIPHFDLVNAAFDTVSLRKFTKWISPEPHNFTSVDGGVPKKVVIAERELNFGFKPVYYDGDFQLSTVTCTIDDRYAWRGTGLGTNPYTYIYYHLRKEWDWLNDGKHKLYARYGWKNTPVLEYEFEVKHSWGAGAWFMVSKIPWVLMMLLFSKPWITIILVGCIFYLYFRRRIKKANRIAKKTNLELQSIQSQLNPHFIFNAMGSIQGLINKNEIEKANAYLTDFSKLLRNSLNNSGREMVALSEELRTLDSYVKLEKLRFDFQYHLHVDTEIETNNVEIPSLLIQPLVENAIKHGISDLGESALLTISFIKKGKDLVIEVKDNGRGFDVSQQLKGQGTRLTRERIKLLNRSKNKIDLNINSLTGKGTVANLILRHAL